MEVSTSRQTQADQANKQGQSLITNQQPPPRKAQAKNDFANSRSIVESSQSIVIVCFSHLTRAHLSMPKEK